jgi:chromosome segregation protein
MAPLGIESRRRERVQLRRLELIGFKTFVNRTELEFHPGVTAIVGPNGSGKSNIMDAIRWALGETNARMLRGARMEDIIFSGSAARRPHSLARVVLTLDNSSGLLPLDYSEVSVSRTVTRGGDGEFEINGTDCRLRDIQMLFLGTGLGGRSYALIGQGEVDAVLRATPVERRQWLEEAAGLARHKRQRIEAERRLGHAQGHLDRLTDVVAELETQQQSLAAQADAASKYQQYSDQLRDLELALFADEARRLLGAVRRLSAQVQGDRDALAAAGARVAEAAEAIASVEADLAAANDAFERGQQALLEGAERASALAAEAQALGAQAEGLRARQDDVAADERRLSEALERLRVEVAALRADAEAADRERAILAQAVAQAEARLASATGDEREAEEHLGAARARAAQAAQAMGQVRNDLAALRARADIVGRAVDALAEKAAALDREEARAAEDHRLATERCAGSRRAAQAAGAAVADRQRALESCRATLAALVEQAHAADVEQERLRARLASLEEAHQQCLGFEDGVRAVLLESRAAPRRFPGLRGAVADALDVPESYRAAIAAALGRRLHCLVVDRRADIDAVVEFLNGDGRGGATVLAMETVRPRRGQPLDGAAATRATDVVGVAAAFAANGDGSRLMEALLGDVVIVPDLASLWALHASGYAGRAVTTDGILLSADGVVSIRGWTATEAGPLGRGQAIAALRDALARVAARRAALDEQRSSAAAHLREAEDALAAARERAERAERAASDMLQEVHRLELEARRLADDRQAILAEDRPRAEELRRLTDEVARLEAQARELEAEQRRLDEDLRARQAESARLATARESAAAEVAARQMALVTLDGRRETLQRLLDDRGASAADLQRRMEEVRAAATRLAGEVAEVEARRARASEAHRAVLAAQASGKAELERLNARRAALRDAAAQRHGEHLAAQTAQREAEAALHRAELRGAQAEAELVAAAERLQRDFGVSLDAAASRRLDSSREDAQRRLEALRTALRELGPVNLRAIDEYGTVTARLDAMRAHLTDLRQSIAALRDAVIVINAALRVGFRQTFEEVDREFGRLFQRLFDGGEGHLELVEAEDGGEPGLEVMAQLPGKARRALVGLSGGERVLVALALIFAMLRVHPSPFCIFDEVEAALDDTNTRRFTTLLRDLAQQTQVLIITHNKGTMAAADVLYGVTMQEPGVSSLVSVRLVSSTAAASGDDAVSGAAAQAGEPVALPGD